MAKIVNAAHESHDNSNNNLSPNFKMTAIAIQERIIYIFIERFDRWSFAILIKIHWILNEE